MYQAPGLGQTHLSFFCLVSSLTVVMGLQLLLKLVPVTGKYMSSLVCYSIFMNQILESFRSCFNRLPGSWENLFKLLPLSLISHRWLSYLLCPILSVGYCHMMNYPGPVEKVTLYFLLYHSSSKTLQLMGKLSNIL
jgi:hypothetical protein